MFVFSELEVAITSPSFVALLLLLSEIANILPETIYCCFTRTTLFTNMFTVIFVVCSLRRMSIPSFLVVVSVSYMAIYVPIVMYGLRLIIVFLQELQCLPNCLHVNIIRVIDFYHSTKFWLSTQVFEIH